MKISELKDLIVKLIEEKGVSPDAKIYSHIKSDTVVNVLCIYSVYRNTIEISGSNNSPSTFKLIEEKFEEI